MQKILFSIDLDGTLINHQHQINDLSREALIDAYNKGHEILINTGRGAQFVEHMFRLKFPYHYDKFSYSVMNGAFIYKLTKDGIKMFNFNTKQYDETNRSFNQIINEQLPDEEHGQAVETSIKDEILKESYEMKYGIHLNDDYKLFGKSGSVKRKAGKIDSFDVQKKGEVTGYARVWKIQLFHHDVKKIQDYKSVLEERYQDRVSIATSFAGKVLEITHKNSNKGHTVQVFKEMFEGYKVVSHGDSGNDLSAFRVSDICYIPSNSPLEYAESNTVRINNDNNDNVAQAITKELGIEKPRIIAHRGGIEYLMPNSKESFKEAYSFKEEIAKVKSELMFETEVRLTKDDQLIVYTGESFENESRKIIEMTLEEALSVKHEWENKEYSLLSFEELLTEFDVPRIYVEIMDKEHAKKASEILIDIVEKHNAADRVVITADDTFVSDIVLNTINEKDSNVRNASSTKEDLNIIRVASTGLGSFERRSTTLDLPVASGDGEKAYDLLFAGLINLAKLNGYQISYRDIKDHPIKKENMEFLIEHNVFGIVIENMEFLLDIYKGEKDER